MTRLTHIQDAFQRFLTQGDSSIKAHVVGTQRVPVETRLGIYGDGYRARLIEGLQANFPVLAELLGESDFEALGMRYVQSHESTFASIRFYGDRLPAFLANDSHYASAPILAELARWEWTMAAVFDAPDTPAVGVESFATIPPDRWAALRFDWNPSVQVLDLEWNVGELWRAVTEKEERPDPALSEPPARWLLWRSELQIYFRPLAEEEANLIEAARAGQTFGELCLLLSSQYEEQEASRRAAELLRGWVQSGLIMGTHLVSGGDE